MPISLEELNRQFPSHGSNYNDEVRVDQAGWGDRFGASVDRAQSQLLGVGEALGLNLGDARRDNQIAAEIQRSRAVRDTGATDNWRDINGVGSFGSFVGGMAVDSAPELLTSVASGGAGALAGLGTLGRLGLAAATNAPAALGDILQNQREESGRTNLASAIPLTVPYVAADLLGLDAALASGKTMRTGLRSLDQMTGAKGLAARTAANAGLNFLAEGTGETGQEFVNQFGRMTVNPDQTVFNPEANERYVDSFVGGGLLGGSMSSVMGGWRRSEGYQPKGVTLPSDQSLDDPATPADLLGSTQNQAPAALGFSGYNTGVGELVSFPDGSVMLRSEYEDRLAKGLAPDGSVEFVPPAMSDMFQRSEPYQYEGAVPFEVIPPQPPGVMPTERPAPLSQVPVAGVDGNQLDLFSLQEAPLNQFSQLPQAQEITATPRDTLTRDMLVESPTAMVPTMFNPLNESQQVGSRGAVAGNIRSQLSQQLGGAGDMTVATQLSLDIAGNLGNLGAMTAAVDERQRAIEKNLVALDRKVSGDSNMLSPDEYATRREALENKLLTVEAARTLLTRYQQAQTNAYADEARGRGQPGQTVGAVPESNATETEMRDNSMRAAVAETDARVQQGEMDRRQDDQAKDRMAVLRQVLSEPTRSKPVARFRKALRDAGFNNLDVTPAEQAEIDRVSSRRADVRDATMVPPGLAAANNLLIPRSTFDNGASTAPAPTQQDTPDVQNQPQSVAATTGAEAVGQPAQAATAMGAQPASQATGVPAARTAAVETSGLTEDADIAVDETPLPATKAKPTRANKKVAIESSVQDLMDAVDAATDELEYDGAVDALYRRYMEGADEDTDAVLDYVQAQPKSFSKDWSAAEKRYDDTERGVTGTRGLAQKNDAPTSDQIKKSVESDMPRGVWTRFSQGAVQPAGKSVSLERVQQIVQQVLGKLGIAGVVRVEAFRNPTDANLTTPDGVVPAGVTLNGGRILLFADNIGSEIDVFRTLFHELFHLGLSKSLGQTAYIQQMLKFKLDPLVNKYALRWKGTADGQNRKGKLPVNNYEALAVEEALADIAEDLATDKLGSKELRPFVRSMVGKLASIAQAVGLDKVAQSLRRMTYTQAEKFVMDTVLGANYAAPTQLRGKRFAPGASAFKRWFGDSKAVDADGNNGNFDPTNPDIRFRQANTEAELRALDKEGGTPAAMVERLSKTPMGYMVRNTLGSWRKRHGVLGWLTMDQIKDRFAEFPAVVKAADKVLFMGSRANALLRSPTALHRQWAKFARENKGEVANNLNNLFIRSTLAEAWVDGDMEPRLDPRNKHIDFTDPKKAAAVAKARTLYVSLPKEGQEIYKRVTAELDKQFRAKQEAILKRVVDVYRDSLAKVASPEELMEIARGGVRARANFRGTALAGMTMRERLEFQKFGAALDSMYVPRNEVPGPYFPLTRRGDHVVVFKAKSYVALNKALEDTRANLDKLLGEDVPLDDKALEEHSKRVADARKAVADARKAVEDAKGDGTQYVVKFFEGAAQAEDGAAELRKELGHLGEVTQTLRRAFTHNTDSVPAGFMAKLQDQMVKSLPEDSREDVASAVRQMIIQSLPERSAFKAELKRMRVEGVDPVDAMYSFVSASSRNAWTTSRLENATDLAEAMVKASSSEDYDERIVGNELVKRYAQSLEYKESHALIDAASNLSYITNLGFSPGYYMQNMLQPWMISLPVMAGRFGVRNASTAMSDATVDVVKAIHATIKEGKVNGNWEMPLDLSKFSKAEQELLERMVSEGRIDITMRADMGSGSTATGEVAHYLQRASELSSLPAHMVEVTNRVATALAAFRLVQRSGGNVDEALAYAEKVVVQTHVDYSVENAPRFMRPSSMGGFGKLAFQFKRYSQAMVFLWFKLVIDSVRHGRKEDALALLYLSGSNFAMAGLSGLPIAAPMGLALAGLSAAFGDEEDDEDWGEMLWSGVRGVIGETATDVLRKGVPTAIGIDISSKVGQGSILSPIFKMPNANTGQGMVSELGFQLVFGASGAMLGNWADAVKLSKDNPALAVQKLMPRGAKDLMEAVRRDYDGLTDRKGKVLLDEAEVDFGDTLVKALGLESVKVTNLYDRRSAIMDAEYARQDVRTRLMSKYTKARIAGDSEEMADIRSDIDAFNKRNPRDVQILPKNLVASYKQEMVRRREMQNGVRVTKRNRDIVEQYSED